MSRHALAALIVLASPASGANFNGDNAELEAAKAP
jgi:hypothetical protein